MKEFFLTLQAKKLIKTSIWFSFVTETEPILGFRYLN